jgi:hypothetical protein
MSVNQTDYWENEKINKVFEKVLRSEEIVKIMNELDNIKYVITILEKNAMLICVEKEKDSSKKDKRLFLTIKYTDKTIILPWTITNTYFYDDYLYKVLQLFSDTDLIARGEHRSEKWVYKVVQLQLKKSWKHAQKKWEEQEPINLIPLNI